MSSLNDLCIDAISEINDSEGTYTEEKLLEALKQIVRENMDRWKQNKKIISSGFFRINYRYWT